MTTTNSQTETVGKYIHRPHLPFISEVIWVPCSRETKYQFTTVLLPHTTTTQTLQLGTEPENNVVYVPLSAYSQVKTTLYIRYAS